LAALGALAAFVVAFGAAEAGFLLVVALAVRLTSLAALQKIKIQIARQFILLNK
jgi:hypothetical protein